MKIDDNKNSRIGVPEAKNGNASFTTVRELFFDREGRPFFGSLFEACGKFMAPRLRGFPYTLLSGKSPVGPTHIAQREGALYRRADGGRGLCFCRSTGEENPDSLF